MPGSHAILARIPTWQKGIDKAQRPMPIGRRALITSTARQRRPRYRACHSPLARPLQVIAPPAAENIARQDNADSPADCPVIPMRARFCRRFTMGHMTSLVRKHDKTWQSNFAVLSSKIKKTSQFLKKLIYSANRIIRFVHLSMGLISIE